MAYLYSLELQKTHKFNELLFFLQSIMLYTSLHGYHDTQSKHFSNLLKHVLDNPYLFIFTLLYSELYKQNVSYENVQ